MRRERNSSLRRQERRSRFLTRVAKLTASQVGPHKGGYFSFQPLWDWITEAEPDLFK